MEQLTEAQRERQQQVAREQGDEAAALAAIELRIDERRRWFRELSHLKLHWHSQQSVMRMQSWSAAPGPTRSVSAPVMH